MIATRSTNTYDITNPTRIDKYIMRKDEVKYHLMNNTLLSVLTLSLPQNISYIQRYQELVDPLLSLMQKREYRSIWLVASGSSYNACFAARPFMRKVLKKEVKLLF